jgi:pSer/pThr/pTyr-binding forkhead associated (FHA) protein
MLQLILKFQDTVVGKYPFKKGPVKIGRRDTNDIIIDNMSVSGNHAIIDEYEPGKFAIFDRDSLNGTFVSGKRISKEPLKEGDVISIGKHRIFVSFLSEDEAGAENIEPIEPKPAAKAPKPAGKPTQEVPPEEAPKEDVAKTQETNGKSMAQMDEASKELEKEPDQGAPQPEEEEAPKSKPSKVQFFGSLTVLAGGVPQIIDLTKRTTTLGKGEEADIKCSGLLVGKIAATISKRPTGFFLAKGEGMKKPEVNGEPVSTQAQLHDGAEIVIGNTKMTFNQKEEIS